MAHTPETKLSVRQSYIYERLAIADAAAKHGVSCAAAQAWKRAAKANGDDWEKARAAGRLAAGGLGDVTLQVLENFAVLFNTTMEDITNGSYNGLEKAEAISRLSDAYTKTMKAAGGGNPKIAKLAVALEVLAALAEFICNEFPDDRERFVAILEPFSTQVTRLFG